MTLLQSCLTSRWLLTPSCPYRIGRARAGDRCGDRGVYGCDMVQSPSAAVLFSLIDSSSFFRRGVGPETVGQIDRNQPHRIMGADYSAYCHHDGHDGCGDDQTTMIKRTFQACVHWLKQRNQAGIAWKNV